MDIRKFGSFVAFMLLSLPIAFAQTTVVSGTIIDPGGVTWANAVVTARFQQTPDTPGPYTWSGGAFNQAPAPVVADASGIFTITLPSNTAIVPSGSTWQFSVAPNATQQAAVVNVSLSGGTLNLIPIINANSAWPTGAIPGTFINKAYDPSQVGTVPLNVGAMIYNTTTKVLEFWNGVVWAPIGSGGGGGGTVIASAFQEIPFYNTNPTGSTVIGSAGLLDALGNIKVLSDDGIPHAFLNQSSPGANNGIMNALQTTNSHLVVGPDYASVEGIYGNGLCPNYRIAIGCPAPFANGVSLVDYRAGTFGEYDYNTYFAAGGQTWFYHRIVNNQLPAGTAIANFPYLGDIEFTGSGINNGFINGAPDSQGIYFTNLEIMTRGIQSVDNIQESVYSDGDNHLRQDQIHNQRGSKDANGEGFNTAREEIGQNLTPMTMVATSTLAAGATLVQGTLNSNVPFVGDGTYIIDSTKGGAIFQIVGQTLPGAGIAGQWQVNTTLTPDNIGKVAGSATVPELRYGATTNATVTVTGLSGALNTAHTVCVADSPFIESARVVNAGSFSGGTATGVVLALRYPHSNFYVSQGSHACNAIEIKANGEIGSPPTRQLFRIIGAVDSTHYLYTRTVFAGWDNGLSGYANTYDVANAGVTLTRNGSGVVSVPVTDPNLILNRATIKVSGCANSTFNIALVGLISDTGTSVSWPNAGSAASTTCTKDIEVLSKMNNLFSIRDAQEFPAVEVTSTNDPTTFALCTNPGAFCPVDPNTNFQVTAGDLLENHPYADVIMGWDRNLMNFQSQTSDNVAQLLHADFITGFIPESTSWYRIAISDDPSAYAGLGGSKRIGFNLIDMGDTTAPIGSLFLNFPTPANSVFNFIGCVYGCADFRSKFDFWSFPMNGGVFSQTINQSDFSSVTTFNDVSTGKLFNKLEVSGGFSYFVTNGLAGTSRAENLFEWIPGSTKITTSSNFGSSSNIFFMTPTGTSFSAPVTIIGTPDGCATFAAGLLSSTGVACGSGGGGGVPSVFGRTGAISAVSGDYSLSLISGVPAFIGVANATVALPTSSIAANTCTSPATVTMSGVTSSNSFAITFASDPAAVNGWGSVGGLVFTSWPTTNTLNWEVCNQTAAPIVPGALTLNVGVR